MPEPRFREPGHSTAYGGTVGYRLGAVDEGHGVRWSQVRTLATFLVAGG